MEVLAIIEKDVNGNYTINPEGTTDVFFGEGATIAEAKADLQNSLEEVRESYGDGEMPKELEATAFVYKFDIASLFEYNDWINITKFAERAGLNSSLLRQYKRGLSGASEKQLKKIEKVLHELANELLDTKLT